MKSGFIIQPLLAKVFACSFPSTSACEGGDVGWGVGRGLLPATDVVSLHTKWSMWSTTQSHITCWLKPEANGKNTRATALGHTTALPMGFVHCAVQTSALWGGVVVGAPLVPP